MRNVLLIGAGGAIGAILRYLVVFSTQPLKAKLPLPIGTLLVNVLGCLLIGLLYALPENHTLVTPEARNFLIVGILGGFTTFSTFSYESMNMLSQGNTFSFLGNLAAQLFLGFGAVWLGTNLGRLIQH
jgi:crcB protein